MTAAEYDGPVTAIGYSGGGVVRHGIAGVPRGRTSVNLLGLETAHRSRNRTPFKRFSMRSKTTVGTAVTLHRFRT